jgi:antitoxin component YwqK of YwqJK toxin-antitoxin module
MTPTKTHYPNGQLECEGFLNGEVQVGNWTFYYENSNVFARGQYDHNGKPIGIWTEYYENGQIKYEAISTQGNWFSLDADDLEIINYWNEDGIPLIVEGEGKLTTYFDNGNIRHISYWTNKLKDGTLQEFYESGQLSIEREYRGGFKDGVGKVFSEKGTLIYEYFYVKGQPIGKVKEWYESGQIAEEGEYINGEYLIQNFWTETGEQILKDGRGKAIRKYGAGGYDVYEQYYDKGKMTSEKKIAGVTCGQFIPDTNEQNGL